MKDLATFQDEFQRAVVAGDDSVLAELVDTSKENRRTLLGVYRNAYVSRLIDFLETDFEKLHALLGDEQFTKLARSYIETNPSKTPNARWFGDKFPDFLSNSIEYADAILFSELATLERALVDVFDAEDVAPLSLEQLGAIALDAWPNLTFSPHPAIRRIDLSTNVDDIWQALHNQQKPPAAKTLGETRQVIVSRQEGMATFRLMASDEAMMWDEAAKGVRFSVLCEMLAIHGGEEHAAVRAAQYLQVWINSGMLSQFEPG